MIRPSHTDVRKYRSELQTLIAEAEKAGELGPCTVALAYSVCVILSKYLEPEVIRHVGMDYVQPTHDLMRALTNTLGGDVSVTNQEKLIESFSALMNTYRRTVHISDTGPQ